MGPVGHMFVRLEIGGVYLILSRRTRRARERIYKLMKLNKNNIFFKVWQMAACFSLFCFGLIIFRAKSLKEALYIIVHLPHGWGEGFLKNCYICLGFDKGWWSLSVELLAVLLIMDILQKKAGGQFVFSRDPVWVRWIYYYWLVLAMVFWGYYEQHQFFYFQF